MPELEQTAFLYVEDDPMSRQIMEMILKHAMKVQHVTVFEDSSDFAERLQQLQPPPDVILLDIHVRPLNGFEMLAFIRRDERLSGSKVLAVTASVMSQEVIQLRSSGFDGAISKPLSVSHFPDLIRRLLAGESVWYIV
jgi:CheY-like chemotaxis protein